MYKNLYKFFLIIIILITVALVIPIFPTYKEYITSALLLSQFKSASLLQKQTEEISLLIDVDNKTLFIMKGYHIVQRYPVAVGKPTSPSPVGEWKIIEKDYEEGGPLGVRWLRLNVPWGNYGIHGTNNPWSIGSESSAGCIRMFNEDIIKVYEMVKYGTSVKIISLHNLKTSEWIRYLKRGLYGQDVAYVQLYLKSMGFYPFRCDGWYGYFTDIAVRCFQASIGVPVTGTVDEKTYSLLKELAS